jgi:hypothetical protein
VACPTSGDAFERVACELHEANQTSLLDVVSQIAVPAATLVVAVLALLFAIRSYQVSRRASNEERARAGRENRFALQQQAMKQCRRRWMTGQDKKQTQEGFELMQRQFEQSPEVNAEAIGLYVGSLDLLVQPAEGQSQLGAMRMEAVACAAAILALWVDDPFDMGPIMRQRKRTARSLRALYNR